MNRFVRWYGAGPLHLLALLASFALAGYAAAVLLPVNAIGILIWFAGAVIGHDLILMPLYTLADRSATAVFRHQPRQLPAGPWINYLRVPAALSGILLLIWFPLILRLPRHFTASTTLSLDPYLWHWLAVTGALFLLSAAAFALRLRAGRRGAGTGDKEEHEGGNEEENEDTAPAEVRPGADATHTSTGASAPAALPDPVTASVRSPAMTSPATISERVAEMHAARAAEPASEAMAAFAREQAELAGRGPAGVAAVGTVLPDAALLDVQGAATTLYAAVGDGPSVLVIYRGAWCPYCNITLAAYQEQLLPQLTARGIRLVAISPQKPDGSLTMQQKHSLSFPVVSDPGNTIAGHLGIRTQPSPESRAAQLQLGLDVAGVNADGTAGLPMPATVILDAGHAVRWIDVHPDYSTRTEPQQVIDALDHLEQ